MRAYIYIYMPVTIVIALLSVIGVVEYLCRMMLLVIYNLLSAALSVAQLACIVL